MEEVNSLLGVIGDNVASFGVMHGTRVGDDVTSVGAMYGFGAGDNVASVTA